MQRETRQAGPETWGHPQLPAGPVQPGSPRTEVHEDRRVLQGVLPEPHRPEVGVRE